MPKRNIELLTKVRDLVKLEPKKLDMDSWATIPEDIVKLVDGEAKVECGTTACVAGWAVQLSGDKFVVYELGDHNRFDHVYRPEYCVARNGRIMDIHVRARKLLGLTYDEADYLFLDVENKDVVKVLNKLIAGKNILPGNYHD